MSRWLLLNRCEGGAIWANLDRAELIERVEVGTRNEATRISWGTGDLRVMELPGQILRVAELRKRAEKQRRIHSGASAPSAGSSS